LNGGQYRKNIFFGLFENKRITSQYSKHFIKEKPKI